MISDISKPTHYIVDTNVLIDMVRDRYPESIFRNTVWVKIDGLVDEGRFVTSREVYNELSAYEDDVVFQWLKAHPQIIRDFDKVQTIAVAEILAKFPRLVNSKKMKPFHADPWIIALALSEQLQPCLFPRLIAVLTHESEKDSPIKIPYVCKQFGVCCLSMLDMFKREGWEF